MFYEPLTLTDDAQHSAPPPPAHPVQAENAEVLRGNQCETPWVRILGSERNWSLGHII